MKNIKKVLMKRMWKRRVTPPINSLQKDVTLLFRCALSLMILPSEAKASPPAQTPRKKVPSLRQKLECGASKIRTIRRIRTHKAT